MDLTQVIREECTSFDKKLGSKAEVFAYLTDQLYSADLISSREKFIEALYYRESLSETGIGDGIAIPHGKDVCVQQASIAFVRLHEPIAWESLDDKPIQYVFLLAIPMNGGAENTMHIQILSELARRLIRKDVIQQVEKAKTFSEFLKAF
jgi:fructose-specific phosphotransferase system IIA component